MSKRIVSGIMLTLLLTSVIMTFGIISVMALTTYVSVINPETGDSNFIYNTTSPPPPEIAVNITVENVEYLALWQVNLTYDPTLLQIANETDVYAPSDHVFHDHDPTFTGKDINNTAGYVLWGCAANLSLPVNHFNGSGTLMVINFTITKTPTKDESLLSCDLVLDTTSLNKTKLEDPSTSEIPFTEQNGYYEYEKPEGPDISILSIATSTPHAYNGSIVDITVVVKNNGNVSATFNVTAYRNNTEIGKILVPDLPVCNGTTVTFHWNTSGLTPCQNWTISAKAPLEGDVNPSDNTKTDGTVKIKMFGDINADKNIDIFDIVIWAAAFGSKTGELNWDPQADLYQDGLIDIFDGFIIASNFGKTYA